MRSLSPILITALAGIACAQDLSVHVRAGDRPPDPDYLVLSNGIDVEHFQVVLRNLRLQSDPTDGGTDTRDVAPIGPGPYLVDLSGPSLAGGTFTPLLADFHIKAKGYYEMDIDLSPVTDADVAKVPELAPLLGKTYRITGTNAQGTPFTFESSVTQVLVRESVFRMGMNHNNLDVNIAPNLWFARPEGGTVDPASTSVDVRAIIEENVAKSIDAYQDDNLDGVPDPLG